MRVDKEAMRVDKEAMRVDKEQRRVEFETACESEREYYEKQELGFPTKSSAGFKRHKIHTLSGPSHQKYLHRNKWIKGANA